MRVLYVVTGLNRGGAEIQLTRVLARQQGERAVFSLRNPGAQKEEIEKIGVPVYSGNASSLASGSWPFSLRATIRQFRPDIVCGWMYHGNLAATITVGKKKLPVIWNIRHSLHDWKSEKKMTRMVIWLGGLASSSPVCILYNSRSAAVQHEAIGYRAKSKVIPNGIDGDIFLPNDTNRSQMRARLRIEDHHFLLGVLGRAHQTKNHVNFLKAFARTARSFPNFRGVIAGHGVADEGGGLEKLVTSLGIGDKVSLLPEQSQPEKLYPALDFLVLPSWSESFPNVVGEAMSCEVPCLVTNVGAAAEIAGDTGLVVASGDIEVLAAGLQSLASLPSSQRIDLGKKARKRVLKNYDIAAVANRYNQLYERTIAAGVDQVNRTGHRDARG